MVENTIYMYYNIVSKEQKYTFYAQQVDTNNLAKIQSSRSWKKRQARHVLVGRDYFMFTAWLSLTFFVTDELNENLEVRTYTAAYSVSAWDLQNVGSTGRYVHGLVREHFSHRSVTVTVTTLG